jgi:hypothetical protein
MARGTAQRSNAQAEGGVVPPESIVPAGGIVPVGGIVPADVAQPVAAAAPAQPPHPIVQLLMDDLGAVLLPNQHV